MRILALSDARDWEYQRELIDRHRPAVTVLAGDLTSDGLARFWRNALESIPEFRRGREALCRRFRVIHAPGSSINIVPEKHADAFHRAVLALEDRHRKSRAFLAARKKSHVDKFYDFLAHAGTVSTVLVVKGDHDDDFPGDYSSQRINRIAGCREISGRTYVIGRWVFLGLGFEHAGYRRPLRQLIATFRGRVGIVIAHAPQKNVQLIAALQPRLFIRGHFGGGRYLIDGVPSVFTSDEHAIIDITQKGLPRIRGAGADRWETHLMREYPWLHRYPTLPAYGSR